jgi:hypothetical protein
MTKKTMQRSKAQKGDLKILGIFRIAEEEIIIGNLYSS